MAKTIFFTEVKIKGLLGQRRDAYGATVRSSSTIAWLYKKIAFANASAKSSKSTGISLTTPVGGGLGASGMYSRNGEGFIPKPHIKSVAVSHEGNFGSLKKIQVDFTVYSKTQLESYRAFFDLGGDLTVNWGWNDAGGLAGVDGKFEGTIYNFNYSLNGDGGWDCSSYGMAKGVNTISGEVTAQASNASNGKVTDPLGNEIPLNTVASTLAGWQTLLKNLTPKDLGPLGVGCQKMPANFGAAEVPEASDDAQEPAPTFYVSLEQIVKLINARVIANAGGTPLAGCKIICNAATTIGNCPSGGSNVLVSGDPRKVLFPGYAKYGDDPEFDFDFTNVSGDFVAGDLSKICFNIDYICTVLADTGQDKAGSEMAADQSIAGFLNKLFDCVNINSGKRFQLALVQDPNEKNDPELEKQFLVVDINYAEGTIEPFIFTAVTTNSMVRSMNVVSKIPTAMQTTAFVGGKSALAPGGGPIGVLSGNKKPSAPPDPLGDFEKVKKLIGSSIDPAAGPPGTKSTTGPTDANVSALQSALTAVAESNQSGKKGEKERIPFPVDLTLTIDGVEGLFFGNAITCNQLPAPLDDATATKVAFTITKVNHTIADGDWTTTINTVCRMQLK